MKRGLLTDNGPPLADNFQLFLPDVAAVISTAVFTTEIGVTKPSVRAFHAACPALDAQPSRVLFVDDNPANVHGARDAGLTAIEFTNPQQVRPHLHAIGLT